MGDLERIGCTFWSISAPFHSSETLLMTHCSLPSPGNVRRKRCTAEQNVSYPDYLLLFNSPIRPLPQPGKWLPYNLKSSKMFMWGNTWTDDYLKVICMAVYDLCAKWLGWVESEKFLSVRYAEEGLRFGASSNNTGLSLGHGGTYYLMVTGAEGSC